MECLCKDYVHFCLNITQNLWKGGKPAMKRLKGSLITFLIASLICVPLLTFIKIDGEKGVLNIVLYVLMGVSALLMLVFALSSPEYPSFLPREKKSAGAGLAALIAAAVHAAIGIFGVIHPEKRLFGTTQEVLETTIDPNGQVVTDVISSSETLDTIGIVYIAIMLVMAVTFLFYAFGFFCGKNHAGSYVMVPLIPILGSVVRVVLTFLRNTSSTDMSSNYMDTLSMVFLMLFFVSSAKLTVGSAGNASKWAIGSGSAAMFFILLNSAEPVMSVINKEQDIMTLVTESHFAADISLVFFILGYCFYIVNTDIEDYLEEINEDEDDGYGGPVSSKPTLLAGKNKGRNDTYIPEIAMVTTVMPSAQTKAPGSQVAKSGTAYSAPVPPRRDGQPLGSGRQQQGRQRAGYSAPVPPRRVPIGYRLEADELTTKGAGMQVADQFRVQRNEARRRTTNLLRYDGLDAFRAEMKGGRTALDVLESSRNAAAEEDTSLIGIKPVNPFAQNSGELSVEPSVDPATAQRMGEELQKDVEQMYDVADRRKGGDRRKGDAVGGRRATDKQPEEVMASPDESAPEMEQNVVEKEPENEYRDVKLSQESLDSKMKNQRSSANEEQPNMQQNPYQQNMNGMNMGMGMGYGMGMGMGMGMGYGMGMGMGMNNPYDPYAGMGMNNPYASPFGGTNPYAGMGQMPYGPDSYSEDESEEYEDEYYYDDEYDVETADSEEYEEYDEEYDEDYDEYEDEYYEDDGYVEYGDEYDEYGDEYEDYDEGDEYYGDDDSDYYDDEDSYGTYDMSAQGWE